MRINFNRSSNQIFNNEGPFKVQRFGKNVGNESVNKSAQGDTYQTHPSVVMLPYGLSQDPAVQRITAPQFQVSLSHPTSEDENKKDNILIRLFYTFWFGIMGFFRKEKAIETDPFNVNPTRDLALPGVGLKSIYNVSNAEQKKLESNAEDIKFALEIASATSVDEILKIVVQNSKELKSNNASVVLYKFFLLKPTSEQVRMLSTHTKDIVAELSLKRASLLAGDIIKTVEDFIFLMKLGTNTCNKSALLLSKKILLENIETFLLLNPTINQLKDLAQVAKDFLSEDDYSDILFLINKKFIDMKLAETADDFIFLVKTLDETFLDKCSEKLSQFVIDHLEVFFKMNPNRDHLIALGSIKLEVELFISIKLKAIELGYVKKADDFRFVFEPWVKNPSTIYMKELSLHIIENLDMFFSLNPTSEEVKELVLLTKSFISSEYCSKFYIIIIKKMIEIKLIRAPVDFISLFEIWREITDKKYLEELIQIVLNQLDLFFALNPTIEQVKMLGLCLNGSMFTEDYINFIFLIKSKAIESNCIKTAKNFLFVLDPWIPNSSSKNKGELSNIILNNLDLFFILKPKIEQLKEFSTYATQVMSEKDHSGFLLLVKKRAIELKLVKTPDDFILISQIWGESPIGGYRKDLSQLVEGNLDLFFAMNPTREQLKRLGTCNRSPEFLISVKSKVLKYGWIKSAEDFLFIINTWINNCSTEYLEELKQLALDHLDLFFAMNPTESHVQTLISQFSDISVREKIKKYRRN